MADVPKDLLNQIKELERLFTVDQAKLKEVTNHFVKELEKGKSWLHPVLLINTSLTVNLGLSVQGGSIVSSNKLRCVMLMANVTANEPYLGDGIPYRVRGGHFPGLGYGWYQSSCLRDHLTGREG